MNSENFISINIVDTNTGKIFNEYPFIWLSSYEDLETSFLNNEDFINKLKQYITDFNLYKNSVIYTIFITEDKEIIKENYKIADKYSLSDLDLINKYINQILSYLYKCVYKENPVDLDLISIYNKLKIKHPNKINKEVISNYIQSQIRENNYNLSDFEINEILNYFNSVI
jgi:hypothetical protein